MMRAQLTVIGLLSLACAHANAQPAPVLVMCEAGSERLLRVVESELAAVGLRGQRLRVHSVNAELPRILRRNPNRVLIALQTEEARIELYSPASGPETVVLQPTDLDGTAIAVSELIRARLLISKQRPAPAEPASLDSSRAVQPDKHEGPVSEPVPPDETASRAAPTRSEDPDSQILAPPRPIADPVLARTGHQPPAASPDPPVQAAASSPPTPKGPVLSSSTSAFARHVPVRSGLELGMGMAYGQGNVLPNLSWHAGATLTLPVRAYARVRVASQIEQTSSLQAQTAIATTVLRLSLEAGYLYRPAAAPVYLQFGAGFGMLRVQASGVSFRPDLLGSNASTWSPWPFAAARLAIELAPNVSVYVDTAFGAALRTVSAVAPTTPSAPPTPGGFVPEPAEVTTELQLGRFHAHTGLGAEAGWEW